MDVRERAAKWGLPKECKAYGVPRGGQPIAALFVPVDTPEEADVIVDDLVDSGSTRAWYRERYPGKPFYALFNKLGEDNSLRDTWLHFPWEENDDTPAEDNFVRILQAIGEDPNREGLQDTPRRYLKFLREFLSPPDFKYTTFSAEGMDQMIVQSNIPFYSLCEHHIAPFFGYATIAYIPDKKIVGLSKLARTLETYSRRLQNQERITTQVADRLMKELSPAGVAVSIRAQHLCMAMRGVKKHDTWTTTSIVRGVFAEDPSAKDEFMKYIE